MLTAPCAFNALAHPDGELAVARAATAAGIMQVVSTAGTYSLEEVAAAAPDGAALVSALLLSRSRASRAGWSSEPWRPAIGRCA